jgi:spore germination protein (amino acid permease)
LDKFSPKHLALLILGVSIVSLKTYPRVFLVDGRRESWIAMIIASIIMIAMYLYIFNISENNNRPNITEVYQTALGNKLGNLFLSMFVFCQIITLVECASVEASSMHENMLLETPKWFFLVFFVIPLIYVILKDIVAIVIVSSIAISLIIIAGTNLAFLTAKYKSYDLLFPIFVNGISNDFYISIIKILALYGSISIVLPYLNSISTTKKRMLVTSLIILLFVSQMQIVSVTGMLATFEVERLISINFPKLIQTQIISYYEFIEFGELYVMFQVLGGWIIKYLVTFYGILLILQSYNIKVKHLRYTVFFISSLVLVASYYSSQTIFKLFNLLNYYTYISLINFIIIPLIVYTIYNIRNKKNKQNQLCIKGAS